MWPANAEVEQRVLKQRAFCAILSRDNNGRDRQPLEPDLPSEVKCNHRAGDEEQRNQRQSQVIRSGCVLAHSPDYRDNEGAELGQRVSHRDSDCEHSAGHNFGRDEIGGKRDCGPEQGHCQIGRD
jgi:hypothetical protein